MEAELYRFAPTSRCDRSKNKIERRKSIMDGENTQEEQKEKEAPEASPETEAQVSEQKEEGQEGGEAAPADDAPEEGQPA